MGGGAGHDRGWQHPTTRTLSKAAAAARAGEESGAAALSRTWTVMQGNSESDMWGGASQRIAAAAAAASSAPKPVVRAPQSMIAALCSAQSNEGFPLSRNEEEWLAEDSTLGGSSAPPLCALSSFLCGEEFKTKRKKPTPAPELAPEIEPEVALQRTAVAAEIAAIKKRLRTPKKAKSSDHERLNELLARVEASEAATLAATLGGGSRTLSRLGSLGAFAMQEQCPAPSKGGRPVPPPRQKRF